MGARNAKLCYALYGSLPDAPFRVLVFMALTTIDADPVPVFNGRWESLAVSLGRLVPDDDPGDRDGAREREAASRAVRRAITALTRSKAVTVLKRGSGPGGPAEYRLNLFDNK